MKYTKLGLWLLLMLIAAILIYYHINDIEMSRNESISTIALLWVISLTRNLIK